MSVKVDEVKCTGCGICIRVCPEPCVIIKGEGNKVSINSIRCKACLLCVSVCPKKAISKEEE